MTADQLFQLSSLVSGIGWIFILVVSPYRKNFDKFVLGIVVVMIAALYTWMNISNFDPSIFKSFSTLRGVSALFQKDDLLLACWLHILAFDLVVGVWVKKNAVKHGISHAATLPSLLLGIVFAPLGYIVYLITRAIVTKKHFAENF